MERKDIDWSKPVLTFEEVRALLGYAEHTTKDWCRKHPELSQPINGGKFIINRDRFVAWTESGRDDDLIDWSKPIQESEDIRILLGYTINTMTHFCQTHKDFCKPTARGDKSYIIHTEGFISWVGSGREENTPDWSKPILSSDEVARFMQYKPDTMKKWCRSHPEFCQRVGGGDFGIHRDSFIAWFASGRQDDPKQEDSES